MTAASLGTDFCNAIRAAGLTPPPAVTPDGRLHRFHVDGDRRGTLNGWYVLHSDPPVSGAFGSWKTGATITWSGARVRPLTAVERATLRRRASAARDAARAERARGHAEAAERARGIWATTPPAPADHPYLVRKGVPPGVAHVRGGALVLPVVDLMGHVWSLQFIQPDGSKKLLAGGRKHGHVVPAGDGILARMVAARAVGLPEIPSNARVILCEGYATAQTLAAMEPGAEVLAAVDAHNLLPVATAARCQWPDAEIIIAADADEVGVDRGRAAALACGGLLAVPRFPAGVAGSDFNDLHNATLAGRRGAAA